MHAKKSLFAALVLLTMLLFHSVQADPQIIIRPAPGEEMILAAADAQPLRSEQAAQLAPILKTFNEVLWDDLKFAGYFTMAGKSFYPPQPIVRREDVNYDAWAALPFKVTFLSAGTLEIDGGIL